MAAVIIHTTTGDPSLSKTEGSFAQKKQLYVEGTERPARETKQRHRNPSGVMEGGGFE